MDSRDRRMSERVERSLDDLPPVDTDLIPPRETANTRVHQDATPPRIAGLLTPLSHVMTEDARDDLARVSPARWRLRVHMYDPEAFAEALASGNAPVKDENDELHDYVCIEKARPVAHCQPDVLTWLQTREIVGDVVLEWLPPVDRGGKVLKHFVHIPAQGGAQTRKQEPHAPVMRPAAGGQNSDMVERMFERMQQESSELRSLIKHVTDSHERTLNTLSEAQRHTINDLRDTWNEQMANDPRRKIGEMVESRVTQRIVDELGGEKKDPWDRLETEFKRVEEMRGKLSQYFTSDTSPKIDPLEAKITSAVTDLGVLYVRQKMGLPVSGDAAVTLAKQLGDLNKEGEALLGSLEKGAA